MFLQIQEQFNFENSCEYTVKNNSNANKQYVDMGCKIPENICTYLTNYDSYNCNFSTFAMEYKMDFKH